MSDANANQETAQEQPQTLTLYGSPELGKQLVSAALKKVHEKASEQVLSFTADLMEQIELLEEELTHLKGDFAALQAGEFKINKQGQLIYNDHTRGKRHIFGKRR